MGEEGGGVSDNNIHKNILRVSLSCWCFIVNFIECFYVNDEPESKFLYTETIKLYPLLAAISPTLIFV